MITGRDSFTFIRKRHVEPDFTTKSTLLWGYLIIDELGKKVKALQHTYDD
jgi:hypothetical protein